MFMPAETILAPLGMFRAKLRSEPGCGNETVFSFFPSLSVEICRTVLAARASSHTVGKVGAIIMAAIKTMYANERFLLRAYSHFVGNT